MSLVDKRNTIGVGLPINYGGAYRPHVLVIIVTVFCCANCPDLIGDEVFASHRKVVAFGRRQTDV